jgi:hypothetical protein
LNSSGRKKKLSFTHEHVLCHENGDSYVNGLLLAERVYSIYCFFHEHVLYCRSKLTKNFDFELIMGF